jgi:hypothetical protein
MRVPLRSVFAVRRQVCNLTYTIHPIAEVPLRLRTLLLKSLEASKDKSETLNACARSRFANRHQSSLLFPQHSPAHLYNPSPPIHGRRYLKHVN